MDELLKQNASLETLSKGQEQALTKKEKQLQVSSQGLSSVTFVKASVADPDQLDPYVFGSPWSGLDPLLSSSEIVRKTLIPTVL